MGLPAKRWIGLLLMALIAGSLAGCASGPVTSDRDLRTIDWATLSTLRQHPKADKQGPVVIVDVRSPREYQKQHIPGAINIPLANLQANDARLTKAGMIVVYGDGWQDPLSPAAAKRLLALGYSNVRDFRGGMALWKRETQKSHEAKSPGS